MADITITPRLLHGCVTPPPSKSVAHRAIIAAALAAGESVIENVERSEDIRATLGCATALGAVCRYDEVARCAVVDGTGVVRGAAVDAQRILLDCGESGSTLRFFIPVAGVLGRDAVFTGRGRLPERPLEPYANIYKKQGLPFSKGKDGVFTSGRLSPGVIELPGDVSSQFVTGLLMALPLLDGDSEIIITTPLQSSAYVDLTLDVLDAFGITVENDGYRRFAVAGRQAYRPRRFAVEGDYSQAAFWLVANALGSGIAFGSNAASTLNQSSRQGDRAIVDIINNNEAIIDAGEIPDLVPILAVLLSFRKGGGQIVNAGRVRLKESDRLHAVAVELNRLGARVQEDEAGLTIGYVSKLSGGTVDSWNDHRIAMAMAVAATRAEAPVVITGAECVAKSYPGFFEDYARLGGFCERDGRRVSG